MTADNINMMADNCSDTYLPNTGDASQETVEQPSVGPE